MITRPYPADLLSEGEQPAILSWNLSPGASPMTDATLWAELLAYGSGISLSPIHIGLLLLLLLGPDPLRRGGCSCSAGSSPSL